MSDLQTEIFTKVLPQMQKLNQLKFDDDAEATVEVVDTAQEDGAEGSVTQIVWNYIRDNPGCTSRDITASMGGRSGISTRINQLRARGFINTTFDVFPHTHTVTSDEYRAITKQEKKELLFAGRAKWAQGLKDAKKKKRGRPAKAAEAKPAKPVEPVAPAPKPSRVVDLNNLSIVEARKLYDELKQIFGA